MVPYGTCVRAAVRAAPGTCVLTARVGYSPVDSPLQTRNKATAVRAADDTARDTFNAVHARVHLLIGGVSLPLSVTVPAHQLRQCQAWLPSRVPCMYIGPAGNPLQYRSHVYGSPTFVFLSTDSAVHAEESPSWRKCTFM